MVVRTNISTIHYLKEKLLCTNSPAVRNILLLNIGLYVLFVLVDFTNGFELQKVFGVYPTYSEHFRFYQLFTFQFVHSIDPFHLIGNAIYLLFFSPSIEKKLGSKGFILSYFICSWMAFVFINYTYYLNKETIEKNIITSGIHPDSIPVNENHEIDPTFYTILSIEQSTAVREYNYIISKTYGASGALYGIIVMYLIINFFNYKKIICLLLGLFGIYENIAEILKPAKLINGSCFAHIGGMIGGLIFLLLFVRFRKIHQKKIECALSYQQASS